MRTEHNNVYLLEQEDGQGGLMRHIERVGRICYRSEENITETSAAKFVDMLVKRKHYTPLEHGAVYLRFERCVGEDSRWAKYEFNKYSRLSLGMDYAYVSTNYRVIVENHWDTDLDYMTEFNPIYHVKRITAIFTSDIGISREFNRHRANSVNEESTRYCNYTKDKFGGIGFILPKGTPEDISYVMREAFEKAEEAYQQLISMGIKPQMARKVLPLGTATHYAHTAYLDDWEHFISLRSASDAHPDAQVLSNALKAELLNIKTI